VLIANDLLCHSAVVMRGNDAPLCTVDMHTMCAKPTCLCLKNTTMLTCGHFSHLLVCAHTYTAVPANCCTTQTAHRRKRGLVRALTLFKVAKRLRRRATSGKSLLPMVMRPGSSKGQRRVEPKTTYFAIERTFLQWLQISVLVFLTG
jgi:hypothetical protein